VQRELQMPFGATARALSPRTGVGVVSADRTGGREEE